MLMSSEPPPHLKKKMPSKYENCTKRWKATGKLKFIACTDIQTNLRKKSHTLKNKIIFGRQCRPNIFICFTVLVRRYRKLVSTSLFLHNSVLKAISVWNTSNVIRVMFHLCLKSLSCFSLFFKRNVGLEKVIRWYSNNILFPRSLEFF